MNQVEYTKAAYQEAKKTPPEDRTPGQELLVKIDFRQSPNPILRLASGSVIVIKQGMLLEGDEDGNIGIVLQKTPESSDKSADQDKDPREGDSTDEETAEDSGEESNLDTAKGGDSNFGPPPVKSVAEVIAAAKKLGKEKEEE